MNYNIEVVCIVLTEDNMVREIEHVILTDDNRTDDLAMAENIFIDMVKDVSRKNFTDDEVADIISDGYYEGETDGFHDGRGISSNFTVQMFTTTMRLKVSIY